MRLDTVRSILPHYILNQTGCLHQKVFLLPPSIQQQPPKMLALFQFLVLDLNSRGESAVEPAVFCFMESNYFAALICEVNWLLREVVVLFSTTFLVLENLPCLHRLSQCSDRSKTNCVTVYIPKMSRGVCMLHRTGSSS